MYIPPFVKIETHSEFRVCFKERALDRARRGRNSNNGKCLLDIDTDALIDLYCRYAESPSTAPTTMIPYFDRTLPQHLSDYWNENERFKMLVMALVMALTPLWWISPLAIGVEWLKHHEIKKLKAMIVTEIYHDESFYEQMIQNKVVTAYSNQLDCLFKKDKEVNATSLD